MPKKLSWWIELMLMAILLAGISCFDPYQDDDDDFYFPN